MAFTSLVFLLREGPLLSPPQRKNRNLTSLTYLLTSLTTWINYWLLGSPKSGVYSSVVRFLSNMDYLVSLWLQILDLIHQFQTNRKYPTLHSFTFELHRLREFFKKSLEKYVFLRAENNYNQIHSNIIATFLGPPQWSIILGQMQSVFLDSLGSLAFFLHPQVSLAGLWWLKIARSVENS
jgi:hypothetical protein